MMPIASFYLGTNPPTPNTANLKSQQSPTSPPATNPIPAITTTAANDDDSFINPPPPPAQPETESEPESPVEVLSQNARNRRSGTMNKEFKFPPSSPTTDGPPKLPSETGVAKQATPTPEVPPPPPVEKERSERGEEGEGGIGEEGMTEIEL